MRGIGAVVIALLLGVACGSADANPSSEDDAEKSAATLRIVSSDPLVVKGRKFAPGERVKLLLSVGGGKTKAAKADERGRFTATFRIDVGRCAGVVVQAFGARGSRAMVDVTAPTCVSPHKAPAGGSDTDPPYNPPYERP